MSVITLNNRFSDCPAMKYNWKLIENGALFKTFSELEEHLAETGHPDYPCEVHRIEYNGKEPWEQVLYSEIENSIGKDTWVCDETTDEFKAKHGMGPDALLGGEFSLEDANMNCKDKPRLRVPEQYEFEKKLVERWLNTSVEPDDIDRMIIEHSRRGETNGRIAEVVSSRIRPISQQAVNKRIKRLRERGVLTTER